VSVPKIGRYEVEDELGTGGMAVVYRARDPYMQRQVAIKVLAYQLTSDTLYQEYFQREAEVIATLEHPCIVPVFDFGRHGNQPYIVMRYMAGGSLQDRLDEGGLKARDMAHIVERVAEGLDAAHARDIIHRDVKPANILFDTSGEAFLSDFGLAKSLNRSTGMTGALFVGTPEYMSPEQVRNEGLDGRSDIYALGVTLFYALAGRLPYRDDSPLATAVLHVTQPVPKILAVKPDLLPAWEDIIAKAMAKAPAERYATAGDLARDVREAASGRWYLRKLVDNA
jgi:serine/threonine protein kinase